MENWKLSKSLTAGAGGVGEVGVSATVLSKFYTREKRKEKKKNHLSGIQTHDLCIARADILPLGHPASPVAKGSSSDLPVDFFYLIFLTELRDKYWDRVYLA